MLEKMLLLIVQPNRNLDQLVNCSNDIINLREHLEWLLKDPRGGEHLPVPYPRIPRKYADELVMRYIQQQLVEPLRKKFRLVDNKGELPWEEVRSIACALLWPEHLHRWWPDGIETPAPDLH